MTKFFNNFKLPQLPTIFFLALILRLVISVPFYSGDLTNHVVWGKSLVEDGPLGFYERRFPNVVFPTYGPLGMVPFAVSYLLFIFLTNFVWFLNLSIPPFPSNLVYFFNLANYNLMAALMKLSAIFGDLLTGVFIYLIAAHILKVKNPKVFAIFYLFNPAVFYLSSLWGQFESLVLAFALGSLYFLFIKKQFLASLFFAFSLLTKQTAVIFAPIFFLLFLKNFRLGKTFFSLLTMAVIFYLSYLPFGFVNPAASFSFYYQSFSYASDRVTESAFNFWYLIFAPNQPFDFQTFAGISYRFWSYLIFGLFTIPPLYVLYKKPTGKLTFFVTFYIIMAAFLFLTRMHERYLAFILPFPVLALVFSVNFLSIYIVISTIHLLNLYSEFFQPRIYLFDFFVGNLVIVKIMIILLFGFFFHFGIQILKSYHAKT